MLVVSVNPVEPKPARIEAAVEVLRSGGIVALPTETFYGLAVDSSQAEAAARLNRLKAKPADAPLLLLAADGSQVEQVSAAASPSLGLLSQRFWPGPLTLVLPARSEARQRSVAVRVPGLALPRMLAAALGRPITGPSANIHGQPPPRTAAEVADSFPEGIDLLLDGGPTPGGAPSTLLDLTGERPRVLRQGIVRETALLHFLPDLEGIATRPSL